MFIQKTDRNIHKIILRVDVHFVCLDTVIYIHEAHNNKTIFNKYHMSVT